MRLLSEVNGISCTRGNALFEFRFVEAAFAAATTSAPSVGSPLICQPRAEAAPSRRRYRWAAGRASDASAAAVSKVIRGWTVRSWHHSVRSRRGAHSRCRRPRAFARRQISCARSSHLSSKCPVLSEQMTDTLPKVSTAGSRRTRALRLTIRCTPMAREIVTTAGRASGTTATARAIPKMNISSRGWPRSTAEDDDHHHHRQRSLGEYAPDFIQVDLQRCLAGLDGFEQLGDFAELRAHAGGDNHGAAAPVGDGGARMNHVAPVAHRQVILRDRSLCFSTGTDSPVSAASSARRFMATITRASAGTFLPVCKITMSPGTRSRAGISVSLPSRITVALGAAIWRNASIARSARYS